MLLYQLAQPSADGQQPALTKWIQSISTPAEEWAERNALHTKAIQEAAYDRTLFLHAERNRVVDMRYPEYASPSLTFPAPFHRYLRVVPAAYRSRQRN